MIVNTEHDSVLEGSIFDTALVLEYRNTNSVQHMYSTEVLRLNISLPLFSTAGIVGHYLDSVNDLCVCS